MDSALLTSEAWESTTADELMLKQLHISLLQKIAHGKISRKNKNVHDQEYSLSGTKSENYLLRNFCYIVVHIKHIQLQHEDGRYH